jgi:PRTRC genetic system protein B
MTALSHHPIHDADHSIYPVSAVVLYGNQLSRETKYATLHEVKADQSLGLGSIINAQALVTFLQDSFDKVGENNDIILPNILMNTKSHLIWQKKRFINPMWFRTAKGVVSYNVEWPPLLFIANKIKKSLNVFALGSNSRAKSDSVIYHAPLMNIGIHGNLCLGNATMPSHISPSSIFECEAALIDSQFTHTNHARTIRGVGSNADHVKFWCTHADKVSPLRVSTKHLVRIGKLSNILKELT